MSKSNGGGVGLLGWMFLIFLTLKLTGYIGWSWLWVTAPLWMPLAIALGLFALAGILDYFARRGARRRRARRLGR